MNQMTKLILVAAAAFVVSSCGGGGGDAGDTSGFSTSPSSIAYTLENGYCGYWHQVNTKVTIIGGLAPFRIHNSEPDLVVIDKTEATGQDPVFTVQQVRSCDSKISITVLDVHSRSTVFEITTTEGDAPAE